MTGHPFLTRTFFEVIRLLLWNTTRSTSSMPHTDPGHGKENGKQDFLTLFHLHRDHVYRFAYYLTGNTSEAEDLFQETWLRVVRHLEKIEEVRNVRAWIMSITSNLYRDILRKKKVRRIFLKDTAIG